MSKSKVQIIRDSLVKEVASRCNNCVDVSYAHIYAITSEVARSSSEEARAYWASLSYASAQKFGNSVMAQMGIKEVSQVATFKSYQ